MTDLFRTEAKSTPLVFPYNEEVDEDRTYANNMAALLGDETVDDMRQRQLADAEEDLLQATLKNISRPDMDSQTRSFAESYALTNQALSWYDKFLKDSDVVNKELADRKNGELFANKPQTFLNALIENPEDFEDVGMYDNRIYDINYTISQRIPEPQWDLKMYGRVARDFSLDLVGKYFFKGKGGIIRQFTGDVLSSYGLGHALDMISLNGDTIYEASEKARELYLTAVSANPEEYDTKKEDLMSYILSIPSQYRADILQAIDEGPSVYADAGGTATAYGLAGTGRLYKSMGHVFKRSGKLYEKVVQGLKRSGKTSVKPNATSDEVADAIDDRKKSTALVPYRDHAVTVVGENRNNTTLSLEDKTFPTYLLPSGQKVTVIAPPEKRLSLSKPVEYDKIGPTTTKRLTHWAETQIKTIDNTYAGNVTREWLPEARRIRFTYDNNGRGFTKEEIESIAREVQHTAYNALNESKKAKWVYDVEKDELVQTNKQLRKFIQVSAAARDPFTRAKYDLDTAGKAEGGARYGAGPYASKDLYAGQAASRGHYSPALDYKDIYASLKNHLDKHPQSPQKTHVQTIITSHLNRMKIDSTEGLDDFYGELKTLLNDADNKGLDKTTKKLFKAVLKDMIKEYSKRKTGVINNWMLREFDSDFGIDQRNILNSYSKGLMEQSPQVQRGLKKVWSSLIKDLEEIGAIVKSDHTANGYRIKLASEKTEEEMFNTLAFKKLFPLESREATVPIMEHAEVLSYYYPFYIRADFGQISIKDLERFGVNDSFIENPSAIITPEMEELVRYVRVNAMKRFSAELSKNKIRYGAQSLTNFVVFQDKPSMYSNVFRQEYNLKGIHTQRVLDNGYVIRYDPEIRGYVLDYYMTTPGRGRKPVIIHKQPLKEFDPKYTEKDKE